ncbi:MAG: HEPN domain-containing protein, partial [bacterium]|nr:HEPN domain-containing protein [bacterium]
HELDDLLDIALKHDQYFEKFRDLCEVATKYYIEERYPFVVTSEITKKEIGENLAKAKKLRDKITEKL